MSNKLTVIPAANAKNPTEMIEHTAAAVPRSDFIAVMETLWIAGPAIKNTSAAPGEKPLRIKAAAIGTEALEQT